MGKKLQRFMFVFSLLAASWVRGEDGCTWNSDFEVWDCPDAPLVITPSAPSPQGDEEKFIEAMNLQRENEKKEGLDEEALWDEIFTAEDRFEMENFLEAIRANTTSLLNAAADASKIIDAENEPLRLELEKASALAEQARIKAIEVEIFQPPPPPPLPLWTYACPTYFWDAYGGN